MRELTPIAGIASVFLMVLLHATSAHAEAPKVLTWDDLVPNSEPIADPFGHLSEDQRYELDTVLRDRLDRRQGLIEPGSEDDLTAREREATLAKAGTDIDAAEQANDAVWQEIQRRNSEMVESLDGVYVRLPGYALPLENTGVGVTEMLLVPYFGACIHVPPPPPNQTVFVEFEEPFIANGLYEPVWITGKLKIERTSRALSFVDGQADIPTGYAIQAAIVEPYN